MSLTPIDAGRIRRAAQGDLREFSKPGCFKVVDTYRELALFVFATGHRFCSYIIADRFHSYLYAHTLFVCLLISPVHSYAQKADMVVVRVILNTEDKGDHFSLLTAYGDALFLPTTLKKLGLQHVSPQVVIDGEAYVSLASLAPEVNFTLDAKESTLLITADPGLFRKHRVDLGRQRPRQVNVKENSAVLNYSLHSSMQDDLAHTVFSVPWEIAIKLGDLLGFSSFSYTRTKSDESFVRLLTNISVDNAETFQRYILGDVVATSGDGGGSGLFGGFSVSKNFAMRPGFIKFPGLELSSVLQTPSEVAVYVNDRLVR